MINRCLCLRKNSYCILLILSFATVASAGFWYLPYPRPAKYDYTQFCETANYQQILSINSMFFADNVKKGWEFYKSRFVAPNGLVRKLNQDSTDADVAVSEGIGYGMLLALINNDQPTFNKIFEAGNSYMWDNNRKSYFRWKVGINGSSQGDGAATDADMDIALALVFADMLAKRSLWNPYSSSGVSYHSRAMDIIKSIKANMTHNDYLLPGDNWGASAINNLNPSYFGTAWFKVFNAYQKEVDYTGVIDKCYDVLKKCPHYKKGQAPDWCNSSGGRAEEGRGYGMTYDGIRTIWRIAVDALWFDDPRAKEFCANTKNTITQYASADLNNILPQMAMYSENFTPIKGTINGVNYDVTFMEIAVWTSGILGAKDPTYSGKIINLSLMANIKNPNLSYFGPSWEKNNYFRHSVAILAYATINGLFPNVYEDLKDGVPNEPIPPRPVKLLVALAADKAEVSLPSTVKFSATLDTPASWTLTIKGRSSGKTESFTGSNKDIIINWNGQGWYDIEVLDATLKVNGLDPQTDPAKLTTSVKINSAPKRPAVEAGGSLVIHDMENKSTVNNWGGAWFLYTDKAAGGTSSTTPATATQLVVNGAGKNGSGFGIKVSFDIRANPAKGYQFAGVGMDFFENGLVCNLSMFESISFDYKTEGINQPIIFSLATANITDNAYARVQLNASSSWQTKTVALSDLKPPSDWGSGKAADFSKSTKIQWQLDLAGTGTLYIDNITAKLKDGKIPADDILSKLQQSKIESLPLEYIRQKQAMIIFSENKTAVVYFPYVKAISEVLIVDFTGKLAARCSSIFRTSNNSATITFSTHIRPGLYCVKLNTADGKSFGSTVVNILR